MPQWGRDLTVTNSVKFPSVRVIKAKVGSVGGAGSGLQLAKRRVDDGMPRAETTELEVAAAAPVYSIGFNCGETE